MKLQLTDEQIMIRDMIRDFARSEIEPAAQDYNDRGEYPAKQSSRRSGSSVSSA